MQRKERAFTLIELLVVIAIIALLVSILVPSLSQAKELAKAAMCGSNLKNIGTAIQIYTAENSGFFPQLDVPWGSNGYPFGFWSYRLFRLKYIEIYSGKAYEAADGGIMRCPSRVYGSGWSPSILGPLWENHFGPGVPGPMAVYRSPTDSYPFPPGRGNSWWPHDGITDKKRAKWPSAKTSEIKGGMVCLLAEIQKGPSETVLYNNDPNLFGQFYGVHQGKNGLLFVDNHVQRLRAADSGGEPGLQTRKNSATGMYDYPFNGDLQE